jgi:hypothetical protein
VRRLEEQTGTAAYRYFLGVHRRSDLSTEEFTLGFKMHEGRGRRITVSQPYWWIPEIYARTKSTAWGRFSHIWFAQGRPAPNLTPPFSQRDARFLSALRATVREIGVDRMMDARPRPAFLQRLAHHYQRAATRSRH